MFGASCLNAATSCWRIAGNLNWRDGTPDLEIASAGRLLHPKLLADPWGLDQTLQKKTSRCWYVLKSECKNIPQLVQVLTRARFCQRSRRAWIAFTAILPTWQLREPLETRRGLSTLTKFGVDASAVYGSIWATTSAATSEKLIENCLPDFWMVFGWFLVYHEASDASKSY